ncbi:MAG: hypothetical protein FWE57_06025 [Chitinispirillia bacterium]|nr:hypothetical protein [Chitinispirillia bacterium]
MLTVFLWIALIFLFLICLLIISPIRFRASAKYAGDERFSYEFFVSYLHPLFLRVRYSSENDNTLRIIWKTFKLKQTKESDLFEGESFRGDEESTKKTSEPSSGDVCHLSTAKDEEKFGGDNESAKSESRESAPVLEETDDEDESPKKRTSLLNRIKRGIEKIKKSKPYQFLSDAVLRKKVKSWLGRCLKHTLKVIIFQRLKIRAKIGLMNPAALGKLCGYFSAAKSALSLRGRKVDMTLQPLFMKEALEFEVDFRCGTSLLRAISCSFIALFTFPYIRTYKVWRQWKRTKVD